MSEKSYEEKRFIGRYLDRHAAGQDTIGQEPWQKELLAIDLSNNNNGNGKKDSPEERQIKLNTIRELIPLSKRLSPQEFQVLLFRIKEILWRQGVERRRVIEETGSLIKEHKERVKEYWMIEYNNITIGNISPSEAQTSEYKQAKEHIKVGLQKAGASLSGEGFQELFAKVHAILWKKNTNWQSNVTECSALLNEFHSNINYFGKRKFGPSKSGEVKKFIEQKWSTEKQMWIAGFNQELGDFAISLPEFERLLREKSIDSVNAHAFANYLLHLNSHGLLRYEYLAGIMGAEQIVILSHLWKDPSKKTIAKSQLTEKIGGEQFQKLTNELFNKAEKDNGGIQVKKDQAHDIALRLSQKFSIGNIEAFEKFIVDHAGEKDGTFFANLFDHLKKTNAGLTPKNVKIALTEISKSLIDSGKRLVEQDNWKNETVESIAVKYGIRTEKIRSILKKRLSDLRGQEAVIFLEFLPQNNIDTRLGVLRAHLIGAKRARNAIVASNNNNLVESLAKNPGASSKVVESYLEYRQIETKIAFAQENGWATDDIKKLTEEKTKARQSYVTEAKELKLSSELHDTAEAKSPVKKLQEKTEISHESSMTDLPENKKLTKLVDSISPDKEVTIAGNTIRRQSTGDGYVISSGVDTGMTFRDKNTLITALETRRFFTSSGFGHVPLDSIARILEHIDRTNITGIKIDFQDGMDPKGKEALLLYNTLGSKIIPGYTSVGSIDLARSFFEDPARLNAHLKTTEQGKAFVPVKNIEELLRKLHVYNADETFNRQNFEKMFHV